jgi:hypothetical protein
MGIKEEELQVKGTGNIFNKIIAEYFPNLKKEMPIQIQEAYYVSHNLISMLLLA